jgi:hypothetical protein
LGWISIQGFTGPMRLATCEFVSFDGAPDPTQFSPVVVDAAAPSMRPIDAELGIEIRPRPNDD